MEKVETDIGIPIPVPVSFIPTPTKEYRTHRKIQKTTVEPGQPAPQFVAEMAGVRRLPRGSRMLIWKQDPSVTDIGIRKIFIPFNILPGPKDFRISNGTPGLPVVNPNAFGDFIQTPNTDSFDAVHSYAVVRMTLTMCQRVLGNQAIPWQWNGTTNTDPLSVFPHGLPGTMNAYYSRSEKALRFGDFTKSITPPEPPRHIYTCRSFDIVAHETGHAILDGLKPSWILMNNPPQTGGLHESFGDLCSIFLTLSQMDLVESIIAYTKSNLHDKIFLSDLAEEFGLALGRTNGLRNADNNLKLSETGNEVHAISQVFTGAIYDILADIFAFERDPYKKDDAQVLYEIGQYLFGLVLRSMIKSPDQGATYADVAKNMLKISNADHKPVAYQNFIRNRFTFREVIISPVSPETDYNPNQEIKIGFILPQNIPQNRNGCCGTLNHYEYTDEVQFTDIERKEFTQTLQMEKR